MCRTRSCIWLSRIEPQLRLRSDAYTDEMQCTVVKAVKIDIIAVLTLSVCTCKALCIVGVHQRSLW